MSWYFWRSCDDGCAIAKWLGGKGRRVWAVGSFKIYFLQVNSKNISSINRVRNNQMSQTIRFVHLRPKHVSAEKDLQRNVSLPKLPRAHVQYSFQCPVCLFQSQKMETFQFCCFGEKTYAVSIAFRFFFANTSTSRKCWLGCATSGNIFSVLPTSMRETWTLLTAAFSVMRATFVPTEKLVSDPESKPAMCASPRRASLIRTSRYLPELVLFSCSSTAWAYSWSSTPLRWNVHVFLKLRSSVRPSTLRLVKVVGLEKKNVCRKPEQFVKFSSLAWASESSFWLSLQRTDCPWLHAPSPS